MSRVGKQPIKIPDGVKVAIMQGQVEVEGPRDKLVYRLGTGVKVANEDGHVLVSRVGNDKQARANFGTTRALINNMVEGVTKGFKRNLELSGVGFNARMNGQTLTLVVGFSHDVNMEIPKEVKCTVTKTTIELESSNKELVGAIAAKIRNVKPPEPYLGKGIKYAEETVRRKAGKTGKK